MHYLVSGYFSQPRWGVSASFQNFAVEPLVNVARRLGAPLPAELKLTGQLDAAIGYSGTLEEGAAKLHHAAYVLAGLGTGGTGERRGGDHPKVTRKSLSYLLVTFPG